MRRLVMLVVVLVVSLSGCSKDVYRTAKSGNATKLDSLIANGADINARDKNGWTPIDRAAALGDTATVKLLASRGADMNRTHVVETTINQAIGSGSLETVEALLAAGANVNTSAGDKWTPLHQVAALSSESDWGYPESTSEEKNKVDEQRMQMIDRIAKGDTELASVLLAAGADANAKTMGGITPLHYAAVLGRANLVQLLLNNKANQGIQDEAGNTSLHYAVYSGSTSTVRYLLARADSSIDKANNEGNTPLHIAAGFPAFSPNPHAELPMPEFKAYAHNTKVSQGMVKLLLSAGANPGLRNKENKTPTDLAREWDNKESWKLLER